MTEPYEFPGARRAAPPADDEEGRTFRGAVAWTIAGTVVPGLGFFKARRWPEAIVTLVFFLAFVAGAGYLLAERAFLSVLTSSPITLAGLAILFALLGAMITAVIAATYLALRPQVVTARQRVQGALLVLALSFLVCVPLAIGIGYSLGHAGIVR